MLPLEATLLPIYGTFHPSDGVVLPGEATFHPEDATMLPAEGMMHLDQGALLLEQASFHPREATSDPIHGTLLVIHQLAHTICDLAQADDASMLRIRQSRIAQDRSSERPSRMLGLNIVAYAIGTAELAHERPTLSLIQNKNRPAGAPTGLFFKCVFSRSLKL